MAAERELLHALAMAGLASTADLAAAVDEPDEAVAEALSDLAAEGLVEDVDGEWYVTAAGDDRLTALCRARFDDDGIEALAARHETFEALDRRMKELATAHQETGDADLVADLADLHAEVEALFEDVDDEVAAVYEPYLRDLRAAVAALEDGQDEYFTGTDVDSYHEVWFDLHDDLLRTLGAGRHA